MKRILLVAGLIWITGMALAQNRLYRVGSNC